MAEGKTEGYRQGLRRKRGTGAYMQLRQHVAEVNEKGWRQVSDAAGVNVARAV